MGAAWRSSVVGYLLFSPEIAGVDAAAVPRPATTPLPRVPWIKTNASSSSDRSFGQRRRVRAMSWTTGSVRTAVDAWLADAGCRGDVRPLDVGDFRGDGHVVFVLRSFMVERLQRTEVLRGHRGHLRRPTMSGCSSVPRTSTRTSAGLSSSYAFYASTRFDRTSWRCPPPEGAARRRRSNILLCRQRQRRSIATGSGRWTIGRRRDVVLGPSVGWLRGSTSRCEPHVVSVLQRSFNEDIGVAVTLGRDGSEAPPRTAFDQDIDTSQVEVMRDVLERGGLQPGHQ